LQCVLAARILTVDFVVCTLAVKKKIRAGFDMSDRTIPLLAQRLLLCIQTTATLGINDRVSETMEIVVELQITSQAPEFFNQILSFLAYGGSSTVKTLVIRRMVRAEVEISASVGGFPVDFGG
jgi:hypothetical protein